MRDEVPLIPESLMLRVAERLKVLGQPVRLRIVEHLATGASTPQETSDALGLSQQNVSKHLLSLHRAGVVSRRPEGVYVIYELADPRAVAMLSLALESVTEQLGEMIELASATGSPRSGVSSERPVRTGAAE